MSKKIILCADDFGQNQTISEAIVELIRKNRLSATSCMVTSCYWPTAAKLLQNHQDKIDVGLHFDLTEGKSLASVIVGSYLGRLQQQKIAADLVAQLETFHEHFGRYPDYIDGHQHIQQLPIIRQALIEVYQQYYPNKNAYIRALTFQPEDFKQWVLQFLGAKQFVKLLAENNIPYNRSFSGIYNLKPNNNYRKLFQRFLSVTEDNGIIMCHPGKDVSTAQDAIAAARINEYQYFMSENFISDLVAMNCQLGRFDFSL